MHFSTILATAFTAGLALAAPAKRATKTPKLQFWGVNESGAEFGSSAWPGVYGKDYTWYDESTYDVRHAHAMKCLTN